MSIAEPIPIRRGDPARVAIVARDRDGNGVIETFTGSEALRAELYAGDARAIVLEPVATWVDPPGLDRFNATGDPNDKGARLRVDFTSVETGELERGIYTLRVLFEDGGEFWPLFEGRIEALAGPGEETEPPSYATYDGILRRAGSWVKDLKDDAGQSGFAEERHVAYQWTHRQVLSRARLMLEQRRAGDRSNREARAIDEAAAEQELDGLDAVLQWFRGLLDAGCLIADDTLIEANEHHACSVIVRRALPTSEGREPYRDHAAWHGYRANGLLNAMTYRVYASVPEEGEPEPPILTLSPI